MDAYHPGVPHFPATFARLAAYVSFFDNSASGRKYIQAVQKASDIMGKVWPPERDVVALLRGASKFQTPGTKSYVVGTDTGVIVAELHKQGHVELAKLVAVCYTYQLRAQSEGFPLQSGVRQRDPTGNQWHSDVIVKDLTVTIALRRRKIQESSRRLNATVFAGYGGQRVSSSVAHASFASSSEKDQAVETDCSRT